MASKSGSEIVKLRVATYNIHRAVGGDGRTDPERISEVIRELGADIVALQEVGFGQALPGALLERLGRSLGARIIEGPTMQDTRGHYGNALLTRLPIDAVRRVDISVPRREPRGAIQLSTTAGSRSLDVVATHLGLRPAERRSQIRHVLTVLEASAADAKVLLGDLNEWFLWGRPIRWVERTFHPREAPATFPARCPWLALDRLWVAPSTALTGVHAHDTHASRRASDHLPLVGELDLSTLGP